MIRLIWASTLERATNCLASAIKPEVATPTWLSILNIFSIDSGMINLLIILLSQTNTTPSLNFKPAVVVPLLTDSLAYSTWNSLPSGLKVVIPWSYPLPLGCIISPVCSFGRHFMSMRVTTHAVASVYLADLATIIIPTNT